MSSFTSKNVRDLYEAYSSVYVDETESILNELLDEVTNNINELVNEGWDFSEYSWDELYESFLDNVLEPELEKVESFIETLNESAETLSEEQIESLLQEWGWFSALSKIGQAKKAAQAVTSATGPVSRPSVLQAPLYRGPKPAPSSAPLQAPIRPVQPKKPLPSGLSVTGGPQKGGIVSQAANWIRNLGKAKQPGTKPPAPTQPPSPKPTATTPASRQPSGTPSGTRLSDRIGTRLTQAWQALGKPAPRPHGPLASFGGLKDKILGTTKRGLATRTVAATDAYGQLAYPDKNPYSLTGLAAGALATGTGAALQGLAGAERFGQKGPDGKFFGRGAYETGQRTGLGYAARDAGETLTRKGLELITQKDASKQQTPPPAETEAQRRRRLNLPPTSLTQQTQSFEMSGQTIIEEPKWPTQKPKGGDWSKLTIGGITKIWDPETKSYQLPGTINKRLKAQGESQISVPGRVSGYKSPAQIKAEAEAKAKAEAEAKAKSKAEAEAKAQPPARPIAQPPARPIAQPPAGPVSQPSPVAKYMSAAAAARKSGDPAQMAAVRDQGLAIWRDKYKDTLAKKVSPTGQQLGTGQSVMAKQADELRKLRPVKTPEAPVNTSTTTTAAPAPQPTVKTDTASQRAQEAQKPIPLEVKPFKTTKIENSKRGTLTGIVASSYEYDAYDLVLEYLLSEGHADTLEEANYVMMQMSSEHIQDIVESPGEWFRGIFNPKNSAASRAQNTSPFSRPTAPLPSYTSPFAKPASRTDSGKLTTYGAGGGAAAERSGQTRDQVMRQGAKNLENKKRATSTPDPNFGR